MLRKNIYCIEQEELSKNECCCHKYCSGTGLKCTTQLKTLWGVFNYSQDCRQGKCSVAAWIHTQTISGKELKKHEGLKTQGN